MSGEDLMACLAVIAVIAANPVFTTRFQPDLVQPSLRIPLTANPQLFRETVQLGRRVIWLHTYASVSETPKRAAPRTAATAKDSAPRIPANGAISDSPYATPETITYDLAQQRLLIGDGYIERVPSNVWNYEVSGRAGQFAVL